MDIRKAIMLIFIIFLLTGCTDKENSVEIQNGTSVNEEEIEEIIQEDKRITKAFILIHEEEIIVAMNLKTFSRFNKDKIEKDLQEKIEKKFEAFNVTVSADMKIIQEINKIMVLENPELIEEKIKKLKSLKEEQT